MDKLLNKLLIILLFIFPIAEIGKIQFGSVSFTLNDMFVFTSVLIWFIVNLKQIRKLQIKLAKPIMLFAGICLFSLIVNIFRLNADSFLVAILYLVRWILYSGIYFILVTRDKKFLKQYKSLLLIPIILIILGGFVQFVFYSNLRNLYYLGWDEHLHRLFSSFLDPNFAGAFLCLSLLLLMYFVFESFSQKKKFKCLVFIFASIANIVAIYITYSRSALIMMFVSLAVFLILLRRKKLFLLVSVAIIVCVVISQLPQQNEGTNLLRVVSSEQRIFSAKEAINIIQKSPIIGIGFNAYRYVQFNNGVSGGTKWLTTHSGAGTDNSFLFVFATTGIIGLLVYLYLLINIFKLGREKINKNLFSIVLISSLIGIMVDSLFINSLFYVYIMEWLWIIVAITENS